MMQRRLACGAAKFFMVVAAFCLAGYVGIGEATDSSANGTVVAEDTPLRAGEVSLANLEKFKEQLRGDLPVGTPRQEVEDYLNDLNIGYVYNPAYPIYFEYGNSIQGALEDIGMRNGFRARLHFWVRLDEVGRVKDFLFRVHYL